MLLTQDMIELIALFGRHKVRYVLVGGFAVNYYGYVRMTQDIDFLLYPSEGNARKIMIALNEFGFGGAGIPQSYFERAGSAIHIGVEPNRIDLLTCLKGIDNNVIFSHKRKIEFEGVKINIISCSDLIQSKKSSKRKRDLADAEELTKIKIPSRAAKKKNLS